MRRTYISSVFLFVNVVLAFKKKVKTARSLVAGVYIYTTATKMLLDRSICQNWVSAEFLPKYSKGTAWSSVTLDGIDQYDPISDDPNHNKPKAIDARRRSKLAMHHQHIDPSFLPTC